MRINFNWTNPVMGQNTPELYKMLYGEEGMDFMQYLNDCPPEVAIISRLVAFLKMKQRGK